MRPMMIEVRYVLFEQHPKLALTKDEKVIQAFAADTAQEPFTKRIGFRCSKRRFEDGDACSYCDARKLLAELAIVVAEQIARMYAKRSSLTKLLSDPGIGGMAGHADVHHPSRAEFND